MVLSLVKGVCKGAGKVVANDDDDDVFHGLPRVCRCDLSHQWRVVSPRQTPHAGAFRLRFVQLAGDVLPLHAILELLGAGDIEPLEPVDLAEGCTHDLLGLLGAGSLGCLTDDSADALWVVRFFGHDGVLLGRCIFETKVPPGFSKGALVVGGYWSNVSVEGS